MELHLVVKQEGLGVIMFGKIKMHKVPRVLLHHLAKKSINK